MNLLINNLFNKIDRSWRPLLDVLLETNVDGQTLSDQDIREEIGTFMFGVSFN